MVLVISIIIEKRLGNVRRGMEIYKLAGDGKK